MNAVLGALASVALAALVAVSAYAGPGVLAAAAALVVLATALGWPSLFELPGVVGSRVVVVLAGLAAIGTALAVQGRTRPLAAFAALVAVAVLAAFAREIVRAAPRTSLVESLTGTFAGELVVVLGAAWVLVPRTSFGVRGVLVAAAAVALARLAAALPWPGAVTGWIGIAAGGAAAALVAKFAGHVDLGPAVLVGVAVAAVAAALDRLFAGAPVSRGTAALVAASAAPVATAGVVAYAVARLFAV